MIELKPQDFSLVAPLFAKIDHNVALVYSVLERFHPGRVFVDRADHPSAALLVPTGTFYYLGGDMLDSDTAQDIMALLFDDLLPAQGEKELVLFVFSHRARASLDRLFKERGGVEICRHVLAFNRERFTVHTGWRKRIPAGFTVEAIPQIGPNPSFGFCIRKNGEIVCACLSVAIGKGEVEIDIYTEEAYQGRGLAMLAACAFIEECLARGLTPAWSCWPYRTASYALAQKLGFVACPDVPALLWAEEL